jgi:hypothetical protein
MYEQNEVNNPNPSELPDVIPPEGEPQAAQPPGSKPLYKTAPYRKWGAVPASELAEIVAMQELERRNRRVWGRWHFEPRNLTLWLTHTEHAGCCRFEIDLEQITTCADMVAWISYVSQKPYVSREDVSNLILALDDIFDIQDSFAGVDMMWGWRSGAMGKKVDPAKVIRLRMNSSGAMR